MEIILAQSGGEFSSMSATICQNTRQSKIIKEQHLNYNILKFFKEIKTV